MDGNYSGEPGRPQAFIHLDLDGLWAVKSVYGIPVEEADFKSDPLFTLGLSRFLELFERAGIRATLFVVGRDCEAQAKRALLRRAAESGHELANHSYSHVIGLGHMPPGPLAQEIARASDAIEGVAGARPVGFRAPGFDSSPAVLQGAARAGFLYDASLLPTRAGPLLRRAAEHLRTRRTAGNDSYDTDQQDHSRIHAGASADAPARDPALGGHYGAGPLWRAPRHPYIADTRAPWRVLTGDSTPGDAPAGILEVPAAVTRRLRLPVHATVAMAAGWPWTRRALLALARESGPMAYVFHPLDLAGGEELRGLPGGWLARRVFASPLARKRAYVESVLGLLTERFDVVLAREFAALVQGARGVQDEPKRRPEGV